MNKTYLVKEIFGPTIQGEGFYAGTVVYFLRFSGCNRWTGHEKDRANAYCTFCDTDFANGRKMTAEQILNEIEAIERETKTECRYLVLSGGEPALQVDYELLSYLKQHKSFQIHMETNGSKDIEILTRELIDWITVSPKQSAKETKLKEPHSYKFLYPFLKDIVFEEFDYLTVITYLQPIKDEKYEENLKGAVDFILKNEFDIRLSLQTHKILGVK